MTGGLVLAAGAGIRFGAPKQLARLDGLPLIEHALAPMLASDAIERVVVVLGSAADEVLGGADLSGAEVVVGDWEQGLSASLRAGVEALAGTQAIAIVLGDQPLIGAGPLEAVLDAADGPEPAVRAAYDGVPGHPVLIKRELYPAVMGLRGDRGAGGLLAGAATVECSSLGSPLDVDTAADLERIQDRGARFPLLSLPR